MLRVDSRENNKREKPHLKRLSTEPGLTRYDLDAEQIGLWTSGGQVFSLNCPGVVAVLLQGMSKGQSFDDIRGNLRSQLKGRVSVETCRRLLMQLQEIERREAEIANAAFTSEIAKMT